MNERAQGTAQNGSNRTFLDNEMLASSMFLTAPEGVVDHFFSELQELKSPEKERVFVEFCLRESF